MLDTMNQRHENKLTSVKKQLFNEFQYGFPISLLLLLIELIKSVEETGYCETFW